MSTLAIPIRPAERKLFFDGPPVLITAFVLVELLAPGMSAFFAGWPIVISLFLVGMPHGAADLAVNSHMTGSRTLGERLTKFAGYLVALTASLVFFLVSPSLALIMFVLISAIHFGLADARDLQRRHAGSTPPQLTLLSALARGCLVLGLPFFLSPSQSLSVFADVVALTGRSVPAIDTATVSMVAGVAVLAAALTQALIAVVRWQRRQAGIAGLELAETGVISLSFLFLHPLFAIGLYVLAWHSWRHMYSLTKVLPQTSNDGTWKRLLGSICRLHIESLPLLIPTVAVFGLLAWWRLEVWSSELLAALTVAFFAVVTLPHHLLVERLSRHGQNRCVKTDANRFSATASTFPMPPALRSVDVNPHSTQ